MKTIYLAGGCFWGVEHYLSLIPGISETTVGYANSDIEAPKYE
ncbi:MAG: peptide-methionine (S)-S-oxide reductase, partial [Erysipelotrichaceae bacterium]|nr:peptide-methionine (S)-S-oxide reductase [Erysipelotrichaceae bacterium]